MTMTVGEQFKVIKRHQLKPPVQTVPIANDLGLEVFRSRPGVWQREWSGLIKKESGGKFNIYVNGDHHVRRRRFTIAHEIAHFILHKDLIGSGVTDDALYRSGLTSAVETQANALAANILMPWHLIDIELNKGVADIVSLAKIFNVSKSSMSIRMGVPHET